MKTNHKIHRIAFYSLAAMAVLGTSSCLPLAAAGAGYVAHQEGYRVRNPIKKVD